jgi:hypothetical protein
MVADTSQPTEGSEEGSETSARMPFWREHSLTLVLLAAMALFAAVFWFAGLEYWQAQQQAHSASQRIWPDYVVYYIADMTDSLFGSLIGALAIVQGTKYFRESGHHPSAQDQPDEEASRTR